MLIIKNIMKSYKTGQFLQHALKDVSLEFRKNEFVSILGASGSGKTTLLNIIGGLDRYDSGDLIINNRSTKQFKNGDWDAYRNNCVGFVFQSYNLISHISVLENVEMGMTLSGVTLKKRRKKAIEALQKVGIKEHAHKKPNQLSGGQMQRVAIARALANDPDIVLADEPTGALDSKTSIQIMDLIKEISKDKLVVMVTHNAAIANKYSTRVIELKDGEVTHDSNPLKEDEINHNKYSIKKTAMGFSTALKLSFNNIITKKGRTLITSFASSIGIIGIALILALSNGFDKQIDNFELNTLSSFPVMITQQAMEIDRRDFRHGRNDPNFVEYPDVDVVYPYDSLESRKIHTNNINQDYIRYIEKISPYHIIGISYARTTAINIMNAFDGKVNVLRPSQISFNSLPKELGTANQTFLEKGYDLLYGNWPSSKADLVLQVNNQNRIEKNILESLGISPEKEISFSDLLGHQIKLVFNDDYYKKVGSYFVINSDIENVYDSNNNLTLTITGIVRGKDDNPLADVTSSGRPNGAGNILYSNDLAEHVIETNKNSIIITEQIQSDFNVLTGQPFDDEIDKTSILTFLGYQDIPVAINIYPRDFNSKQEILNHLDGYNKNIVDDDERIIYTDLAATISGLSGNIMNAITIVLIAFSAISLVVSSIMIGIITYISVIERTKEIGILRALGARKKDITRVFNAETFIVGFSSGLIGLLIARLLILPINVYIERLTTLPNVAQMSLTHIIILIIVSITLTLVGGFIPAKIASAKDPVEALRTE